jgi:hypothetical protein
LKTAKTDKDRQRQLIKTVNVKVTEDSWQRHIAAIKESKQRQDKDKYWRQPFSMLL